MAVERREKMVGYVLERREKCWGSSIGPTIPDLGITRS